MASSLIKKRTVRGDASIVEREEEIAAPPTEIQDAVEVTQGTQPLPLHDTTHESGQTDEISIAGLTGESATPQTPKTHVTTHETGGSDEVSLAGLTGESATAQPPKAHKSSHVDGGSDPFNEADTLRAGVMATGLTTLRYTKNLTTENTTPANLNSIAIAEGDVLIVECNVAGRKADGSERGVYHLEAVFYRNTSGDVTREGNTAALLIRRSTPSLIVDIEPDTGTQTVIIRVTGLAATVKWEGRIIVTRLTG